LDYVKSNPELSTLAAAIGASPAVQQVLSGPGPFTLFAPDNNAFASGTMADYKVKYLLDSANSNRLAKLLSYHALSKSVMSSTLQNNEVLPTVEGSNLFVQLNGSGVVINDVTCDHAKVLLADQVQSNGVVHIISSVFVPFGVFCPDTIFAAEQRSQGRISSYGYDCRAKGTSHLTSGQVKPVGLTVDSNVQKVFWSDDLNYPFAAPTSWLGSMNFNGTNLTQWSQTLVDPQGMDTDTVAKKLYFTEHQGHRLSRCDYNGANVEVVIEKKGDIMFQPSDVAVDELSQNIFLTVEGAADYLNGTLFQLDYSGNVKAVLARNLVKNYGVCVDKLAQHVYYIQGGHGGQINCVAYGSTPCANPVLADILEYPYMCAVDTAFAKYGGPTNVLFSQANRPGQIYYLTTDGKNMKQIQTVTTDLDAPMGVAFGCTV